MKSRYFFYIILLFVCAFIPFDESWTAEIYFYQTQPCIEWGDWTVGQSSSSGHTVTTTFITNSEQTCGVKVAVSYCESQPSDYVYPLNSFDFSITMNNGFTVSKQVKSTSGPDATQLKASTTFSVDAKLTGPSDKETVACSSNGRNNTAMKVTVTFTGYYGSDASNPKTVTLKKTWTQDSKDMLRQEYVDMTPPDSRSELPVPGRSSFVPTISDNGTDSWNTGHYLRMINDGLKSKSHLGSRKSTHTGRVTSYPLLQTNSLR